MLHEAKQFSLKEELALNILSSCLGGRAVKAMDFRSEGGLRAGSIPCKGDISFLLLFFYDEYGGATSSSAGERAAQA